MSGITISPAVLLDAEKVLTGLKIGASFDWAGAIAAFEGQDPEVKIESGLLAAEDVEKILGMFIPEAATAAEYTDLVRTVVVPILYPLIVLAISKLPPPAQPGPHDVEAFGNHIFTGSLSQGTFK